MAAKSPVGMMKMEFMRFDKNMNAFPSGFHREVWWWAVGLVPPEDSLTGEVKNKCGPEVLDGCYQWYDYFRELCGDMYAHADEYSPATARQYRDILESVAAGGGLRGDGVAWTAADWEAYRAKTDRSKAYASSGARLDQCLRALERTGLRRGSAGGCEVFMNARYPKIFHAMSVFERSPKVRETPARHHFAHCEFRQLFRSYSANYDELLRRASDESLRVAHSVHDFCKSLKIQRYIHFGIIKYKHKGVRVLDFNLYGDEYPTMRVNIGTCARPDAAANGDAFYKVLLGKGSGVQETFTKNLMRCDDPGHKRYPVVINGRKELVCPCERIRINPFAGDLGALEAFIEARKASIDGV